MEKKEKIDTHFDPPGMIHVYTGDGKGKTTAALGLAFRAMGHGLRTCMIQFMKNPEIMGEKYGEIKALEKFAKDVIIKSFGRPKLIRKGEETEEDRTLAKKALDSAKEALSDPDINIVILDEIFLPMHFEIISINDIMDIIHRKPPDKELILTGRKAPEEIIKKADLVTEMREIKHYFGKGLSARKGIEY